MQGTTRRLEPRRRRLGRHRRPGHLAGRGAWLRLAARPPRARHRHRPACAPATWPRTGWPAAPTETLAQAPEVAAARVSAWLGHWDFLAATAEDGFRKKLLVRLAQDARGVVGSLPAEAMHRGALVTLKGAIAAAVALEEEAWMTRALRFLPGELERQFHPDGGHVERSPGSSCLLALQDLIEIRNLLHGAGLNPPPLLATRHGTRRPGAAAVPPRRWRPRPVQRHAGGGPGLVDLVLTQGQARGRAPLLLEESGFHRLQAGRTLIIADAGAPPPQRARDSRPACRAAPTASPMPAR